MRKEGEIEGHNKTLDEEPELLHTNVFIWNIYRILDSQREYGFESLQPISITSIKDYFELVGINDCSLREEILLIVAELDAVTRTEFFKKQKDSSVKK